MCSAQSLTSQGWRWTAHIYPDGSIRSSLGDRNGLSIFRNREGRILTPQSNEVGAFTKDGDIITPDWRP